MRIALVACQVVVRELSWAVARSPHTVDVHWLPKELHQGRRADMLAAVQAAVDGADPALHALVAVAFGLCGLGLEGLRARTLPVAVPRVHDCRGLLLGGQGAADAFASAHPGCYVLTSGWLERNPDGERIGTQGWGTGLPCFDELVARYGEDNARYLQETLDPTRHYSDCCHVAMGCGQDAHFRERAAAIAARCAWSFHERMGDLGLLTRLVDGPWEHPDLLLIPPGACLRATHDAQVCRAVAPEA